MSTPGHIVFLQKSKLASAKHWFHLFDVLILFVCYSLAMDDTVAKIEHLEDEVRRLEIDNMDKDQKISSYEHKLALLEDDNEKLEGENFDARRDLSERGSEVTTIEILMQRVTKKDEDLERLEEQLANEIVKSRSLEVEKDNLRGGLDALRRKYEQLEESYNTVKAECEQVKAQMAEMEKQLDF